MKKIIVAIILFFVFTGSTFAHGGFEKNANNTTVYINQLPVAPLVGERVKFTLQFRDPTIVVGSDISVQNLKNIPVEVKIIDTYEGDESKDKVIYTKNYTTDENGNISFSYTFPKENYFDIEVAYKDHNGIQQQTGFLVQPRANGYRVTSLNPYLFGTVGLMAGITIGALLTARRYRNKK